MAIYPLADQSARFDTLYPMTYVASRPKGLLHGTESLALPGYEGGKKAPHFTLVPRIVDKAVTWFQHFDTARPSRALANTSGGVETNRAQVVQVELVGTTDPAHRETWTLGTRTYRAGVDYIYWPDAPRWLLDELAKWMRWVEQAHGVARVSTPRPWLPYPKSYGASPARMTGAEWDAFSGWCAHMHAPENSHGDVLLDIAYLLADHTPAPQEPGMDLARPAKIYDAQTTAIHLETTLEGALERISASLAYLRDRTVPVLADDPILGRGATYAQEEISEALAPLALGQQLKALSDRLDRVEE